MSSPISGCSFALTSLNSQAYELEVSFFTEAPACVSKKQFIFTQKFSPEISEIVDIYSQNGTCPEVVDYLFTKQKKSLFTAKDEKAIEQAAKKWSEEKTNAPSVLVLDLKDTHKSYIDKSFIQEGEKAFCQFVQNGGLNLTRRAQKIHHLFEQTLPVNSVLCEGALKCDLLQSFSDLEAEYLLKTPKGKKDLCQYAEFYMNAFKLGQKTEALGASDYFFMLNGETFKPAKASTVWYPAAYEELYSIDSPFFDVMRPIFSLSGKKDPITHISSVTVGEIL